MYKPNRSISLFLCLLLVYIPLSCHGAENAVTAGANFLTHAVPTPTFGQTGGEWTVIALLQTGMAKDDPYFSIYKNNLEKVLNEKNGILSKNKYTEYARVSLALSALGEDPTSFRGYDLLQPLYDFDKVTRQGINGSVFALMAFSHTDHKNEKIAQQYLAELLEHQQNSGGFGLSDDQADADITAMVVRALCLYQNCEGVLAAVNSALAWLSAMQQPDGGFLSNDGIETAESTSQVFLALKAAGYSENDPAFIKNGISVRDNLLSYAMAGGGFRHTKQNAPIDLMASEQALLALSAPTNYTFNSDAMWHYVETLMDASANIYKGDKS